MERQRRQESEEQARQERIYREREYAQSTSPPPPVSTTPQSTPSPRLQDNSIITLQDIIKNEIDPAVLSVRTLKKILKANYVKQSHVIEKSELVKLVNRLVDQHKAELELNKKNEDDSNNNNNNNNNSNEDSLCRICFDNQQNCVFLDCGHMATCIECAKKLIESRNECPICREPILKLVHVFRS
ncbi:zinc finger, C3HC4 type-domain-containing protein [Pilaira anomala]|nr:zinc finger, C3HC4 type-domain-containing protein [Pilaira anomala]